MAGRPSPLPTPPSASRLLSLPALPSSVPCNNQRGVPDVSSTCLFCRIVAGEIPAKLVTETDDCIAFRDINPQAPVHVLVVPRQHVASLNEARDAAMIGRLHHV